ncbi:hypothetical protein QF031_002471 [Pseudarthrobacter defluvii]|uniref:hypothetical protein n=1 Tax=Pseudarthrobacter defluvii TaxID=410837 RepID=UPI00277DFC06|nr:hypothetical protein [Pseudarthrobacter defluvii]MDQ0769722.1 hypothetical protein [Pseudarthrobacter defluvii]
MNRPDSEQPDQGANQDDAVWLDLVARLESDTVATRPDSPGTEQRPAAGAEAAPETPTRASFGDFDPLGLAGRPPAEPSAAQRQAEAGGQDSHGAAGSTEGPRDYEVDDGDEEFVPEEPPSLAGTEPLTMLAWLGAVGGPVALLLSAMFWRSAPLLAIVGIVAAFVLGTVYLIMKLPQEKNGDDDGARV